MITRHLEPAVVQQHVHDRRQHDLIPDHLLVTALRTHLPLRLRRRLEYDRYLSVNRHDSAEAG